MAVFASFVKLYCLRRSNGGGGGGKGGREAYFLVASGKSQSGAET